MNKHSSGSSVSGASSPEIVLKSQQGASTAGTALPSKPGISSPNHQNHLGNHSPQSEDGPTANQQQRKKLKNSHSEASEYVTNSPTTAATVTTSATSGSSSPYSRAKNNKSDQTSDEEDDDSSGGESSTDNPEKYSAKELKERRKKAKGDDIRPCWFGECVKADRSLKILRPFLVSSCKTHANKSEERMVEALRRGEFMANESAGKDRVCCICGSGTSPLSHCTNSNCAFGFCDKCVDFVAIVKHHGNSPLDHKTSNWTCWICHTTNSKSKEKERIRWVKAQLNSFNSAATDLSQIPKRNVNKFSEIDSGEVDLQSRKRKPSDIDSPQPASAQPRRPYKRKSQNDDEDEEMESLNSKDSNNSNQSSSSNNNNTGPQSPNSSSQVYNNNNNNNNNNNQHPNQQNVYPPLPHHVNQKSEDDYVSILSPDSEPITPMDNFLDQYYSLLRYYRSLSENLPKDISRNITDLTDITKRLKTIRWSTQYDLVWRMLDNLSSIMKRNMIASQSIVEMHQNLDLMQETIMENNTTGLGTTDTTITGPQRNIPFERVLSTINEFHETSLRVQEDCHFTRNAVHCSIDLACKYVNQYRYEFETTSQQEKVKDDQLTIQIRDTVALINKIKEEIQKVKRQEDESISHLSFVRSSLMVNESVRDSLYKKMNDLKVQLVHSKNQVIEKENDCKFKIETLENEINTLNLLVKALEGVYWAHDYFYDLKSGECERLIVTKLEQLMEEVAFFNRPNSTLNETEGFSLKPYYKPNEARDIEHPKTLFVYHSTCMSHFVPGFHLEKPDRIQITVNTVSEIAKENKDKVHVFDNPPEVEMRYVLAVHDAQYIKNLERALPPPDADYETHLESDVNGLMVPVASHKDDEGDDDNIYDTFVSHWSLKAALRASGAVCAAVDAVSRGGYSRAFCAIRPPGHHAGRYGRTIDAPSQGYCLINNVAIGAKYAAYTAGYTRIAVVDFDVHHGNGTQEILAGDDNFLFISIHVCDEKRYFYPGTGKDQGDVNETTGEYDGNILNIGLKRNTGSNIFLTAFAKKIIPRLEAYKPELLFISAGFDGHRDDPTNGLKLADEDYATVTKMLKEVAIKHCNGRIISVLEGGYGIDKSQSLHKCVKAHFKTLVIDSEQEVELIQKYQNPKDRVEKLAPLDKAPSRPIFSPTSGSISLHSLPSISNNQLREQMKISKPPPKTNSFTSPPTPSQPPQAQVIYKKPSPPHPSPQQSPTHPSPQQSSQPIAVIQGHPSQQPQIIQQQQQIQQQIQQQQIQSSPVIHPSGVVQLGYGGGPAQPTKPTMKVIKIVNPQPNTPPPPPINRGYVPSSWNQSSNPITISSNSVSSPPISKNINMTPQYKLVGPPIPNSPQTPPQQSPTVISIPSNSYKSPIGNLKVTQKPNVATLGSPPPNGTQPNSSIYTIRTSGSSPPQIGYRQVPNMFVISGPPQSPHAQSPPNSSLKSPITGPIPIGPKSPTITQTSPSIVKINVSSPPPPSPSLGTLSTPSPIVVNNIGQLPPPNPKNAPGNKISSLLQ